MVTLDDILTPSVSFEVAPFGRDGVTVAMIGC